MHYKEKFSTATTRLMLYHPFFSTLVVTVPYVFTRDVATAATNGRMHFYNPDFLDTLSIEEIMGLRAHEGAHDMFKHMLRLGTRNHDAWNVATDYVINYILQQSKLVLPACGLFNDELGKMTSEEAYAHLMNNPPPQMPKPMDDLLDPGTGGDEAADAALTQEIAARVAQAATLAKLQGRMPAELQLLVDRLLTPQVAWQEALRQYLTRVVRSEETWSRRNRRFRDIYLPSRHSKGMGEMIMIGDTSGSMIGTTNKVATEMNAIAVEVKPERIRILWTDTQVEEQVFEEGEELQFRPAGGGGTDMRVPLEYAEQFDPQVVVMITDGYTPWPTQEPPFPLIVVCTTNAHCPVGDVIRIN